MSTDMSRAKTVQAVGFARSFAARLFARPRLAEVATVCVAFAAGHFGGPSGSVDAQSSAPKSASVTQIGPRPKPWFTIASYTTYVTQPLDANGNVDYLAALNEAASKEVTVDNNAAVLLAQIMELSEYSEKERAAFFKRLGLTAPPKSQTIQWFSNLFKEPDLESVTTEPWPADRFPAVAGWLDAKDRPLNQAVEATRRPRCYLPLIRTAPAQSTYEVPMPAQQITREIARALAARAMLRVEQGKIAEASQDLLACHRLGRLVGTGPIIIDRLLGLDIDDMASRADMALIEFGRLSAADALAYREQLAALPPLPKIANCVDHGERMLFLGFLTELARAGHARMEVPLLGPLNLLLESDDAELWNRTLKSANQEWDHWTVVFRTPNPSERHKRLQKLESEARRLLDDKPESHKKDSVPEKGRYLGRRLAVLMMPDAKNALLQEDRARVRADLVSAGLALAAYHADVGHYPDSLGDLVPKYCREQPLDPFTAKPLRYQRRGEGYSLFSVGARNVTAPGPDPESQTQSDDVVLAIPRERSRSRSRGVAELLLGLDFLLFAPTVLIALVAVGWRLKGRSRPPAWIILANGLLSTTVLAFLSYAAWELALPLPGLVSLALLAVATLGGAAALVASKLSGKPLPARLGIFHALLVMTAFAAYFWFLYWSRIHHWSP
jgi:hypothetical protein